MGWSIGYDTNWKRDIGYGVPAFCDHPTCDRKIDRGLGCVCGEAPYGGEHGCGLYFCGTHLRFYSRGRGEDAESVMLCPKCGRYDHSPYKPKPDHPEWVTHKMTHESWAEWRTENGHPEPECPVKDDS